LTTSERNSNNVKVIFNVCLTIKMSTLIKPNLKFTKADIGAGIARDWMARARFPAGARDLHLLHTIQTSSMAHPASYPSDTEGSFSGSKAAGV
jgi:hypothetical protein